MKRTIKDFIFEKSLLFLALLTLAGLAGIVWFLFKEGMPVLDTISLKHFLTGHDWYPTEDPPSFGIFPLIIGSVSVTLLAAVLAIPLGILCAIYLSEIASSRLRSIFKPFIELLAAMPSVVIGFVGMTVLAPFLQDYFGAPTGLNVLNAAILLALMAVPTICTISEDALRSVPRSLKESSLALGATLGNANNCHDPGSFFRNCNRSDAGFKPRHRRDHGRTYGCRRCGTHPGKPF